LTISRIALLPSFLFHAALICPIVTPLVIDETSREKPQAKFYSGMSPPLISACSHFDHMLETAINRRSSPAGLIDAVGNDIRPSSDAELKRDPN